MWAVPALFSRPSDRWHGGRAEPLPQRSSRSAKTAAVGDGYHSPPISPAAIDPDRLAGDKSRLLGGKIGDHRGDFVGFAKAADRDRFGALAEPGFEVVAIFAAIGADRAGSADRAGADRIDRDAMGRKVEGQRAGKAEDRRLR